MSTQLPLLSITSVSKRLYHGSCTERSRWACNVVSPLLQFLHSILPRYNYSTSLPTCSSPCRSVRRPPAPRHPHMQIRRLPPSHTDSAGLSCRVSEGRGLGPSPPPSAPTTSQNAPSASVRWLCPRSALHPGPKACSTNELMDFQFSHSRWSVSVTDGQCFCVVFVFYTCRSECRPGTSAAAVSSSSVPPATSRWWDVIRYGVSSVLDQHWRVSHMQSVVVYFKSGGLQKIIRLKNKGADLLIGTSISSESSSLQYYHNSDIGPNRSDTIIQKLFYNFGNIFCLLFEICHGVSPVCACVLRTVRAYIIVPRA